jgi:hypothetical protein
MERPDNNRNRGSNRGTVHGPTALPWATTLTSGHLMIVEVGSAFSHKF